MANVSMRRRYWALRSDPRFLRMLRRIVPRPALWPSAPLLLRSCLPGHGPLSERVPWMTLGAIEWLEGWLDHDKSVFEYGSGGSTLFLGQRAGRVWSVEHDAGWYAVVSEVLAREGHAGIALTLAEPEPRPAGVDARQYGPDRYGSRNPKRQGQWFERYVRTIDARPLASLDLVVVDGASRPACIAHALARIRPGGYLLLDNAERERYRTATDTLLGRFPRRDFIGTGPGRPEVWTTSVWRITGMPGTARTA